jgi:FMN phosphatase YigB (HAD superfamily)
MPQMIELVHELAGRSVGSGGPLLALASNTNALDIDAVESSIPLALEPFRGRRYLSHEMGMRKPHPEFFTAVAADLRVPPSACLFVDDLEQNVRGARETGMEAIVFRNAAALAGELRSRLGPAAGAITSIAAAGLADQW